MGRHPVAGAHLAVVRSVLVDHAATAALLCTAAATSGWDVDRTVDAAVDGAGAVPDPAH